MTLRVTSGTKMLAAIPAREKATKSTKRQRYGRR
jgi:hypothetical protein